MRDLEKRRIIIKVTDLHKSFGAVKAVQGVDFTVGEGELFAFLGPNGAGKSTTINMLCTLLRPDSGEIIVDDLDLAKNPNAVKSRIGIVFQDSLLDPILSVEENLRMRAGFYMSGRAKISEAVERAAAAAEVTGFLKRPYGKLSGGQRRRADIARALLNTPRILIMDEPTTGLDPQTRRHVWQTIRELQAKHNMTIFLTTHYMEEAAGSDYVVIVDGGKVSAQGTPAEMKERFSSEQLRVLATDDLRFAELIKQLPDLAAIDVEREDEHFVFHLDNTVDAIPLLTQVKDLTRSFEVLHGTMDDVFINVTGKDLRES